MAVLLDIQTESGLTVTAAYWRLNNFEQLPNRQPDGTYSVPAIARFRGFVSADAFHGGKSFLDGCELLVAFTHSSIDANLATEAYVALKAYDPSVETGAALTLAQDVLAGRQNALSDAEAKLASVQAQQPGNLQAQQQRDATAAGIAGGIAALEAEIAHIQADIARRTAAHDRAQQVRTAIATAVDA